MAAKKTQDLVQKSYYFHKFKNKVALVSLIIDKGDKPFVTNHIDHVVAIEVTKKGYNHLLVIVDANTKFMWLYLTRCAGVVEVPNYYERLPVIWQPIAIVSDRGVTFTFHLFKPYCEQQNIEHLLKAEVARDNGQVERMDKIIVPMLSKLSIENPES